MILCIHPTRYAAFLLGAMLAWALLCEPLRSQNPPAAEHPQSKPNTAKKRALSWNPPHLDWRIKARIPEPACVLPDVLQKAGQSAKALFIGLKSFTAQEDIQFETLGAQDSPDNDLVGFDGREGMHVQTLGHHNTAENDYALSYDYIMLYKQTPNGLVAQDSRTLRGAHPAQASYDQDLGLTELALIFLPAMQSDYDFKCEGTVLWTGQPAWVVRFQQRKDKPRRTVTFRGQQVSYPASLVGRSWIAADSGEIRHMETSSIDAIPEVNVRHWYLSIDYSSVEFPPTSHRLVLPQNIDAYYEYVDRRTIAYHTFTNFKLFNVTFTITPGESGAQEPEDGPH